MTETDFSQQIANASLDLKTIEDFVNLPEGGAVYPRLLPSVDVGTLSGIRDAIFERGGLPATPFSTKTLMESSALRNGDYAYVTDDIATNNNGLYLKIAGAWVKSTYDPLAQVKAYANANPLFKPIRITTQNLNDYRESGTYWQLSSANATTALGYPENQSGVLEVYGEGGAMVQRYTTFGTANVYVRVSTSRGFKEWQKIVNDASLTAQLKKYPALLEWQQTNKSSVSYDAATRSVTVNGIVLAAHNIAVRNVRLQNVSVTLAGDFDVCYLDLVALGNTAIVDSTNFTNFIKIGDYSGVGNIYLPELGKLPLFKFDKGLNRAVACAGFPPIYSVSGGMEAAVESECYYQYSANSLKVYSQIKKNLYVGFNVLYQFYDDDIIYEKYWRIANADFYTYSNGAMTATGKKALDIGESEFVIKQTAAKIDFTGGYHGDEQMTDVLFLADGLPVSITGTVPLTACSTFEYIIKSTMHETSETVGSFIAGHPVIANHIKRTQFLNGGYKCYNKLIFKYSGTVQTVYHGVSCISKDVASVVMTDKTFTPTAMTGSGGELMRETGSREYIGYNSANNLSVKATSRIINNPTDDADSMSWVSDRVPDSKYYRRSPINATVAIGDVLECEFECYFDSK